MTNLNIKTQTSKKRLKGTRSAKILKIPETKREVVDRKAKIEKIVRGPKGLRMIEMKNEGIGAEVDTDHARKGITKRNRKTEVIK
jgi:hypothetical protein